IATTSFATFGARESMVSTERRSRVLATIVEFSQDAIFATSREGVIESWNQGAIRMYGYTAEEAIGRDGSFLVPPWLQDEMPKLPGRLRRFQPERFETVRVTKDGRLIAVALTIYPIRAGHGRTVGAATVARDLTERK